MDLDHVLEVFDAAGYEFLYKQFHYQFYVTGLFDQLKNPALLEKFLDCYGFEEEKTLLFDEFAFHYRIFQNLYWKNNLEDDLDVYWH